MRVEFGVSAFFCVKEQRAVANFIRVAGLAPLVRIAFWCGNSGIFRKISNI
jgi:hypothetical protein